MPARGGGYVAFVVSHSRFYRRPTNSTYRDSLPWMKMKVASTRRRTRVRPGRSFIATILTGWDRVLIRRHGASGLNEAADTLSPSPTRHALKVVGVNIVFRLSLTPSLLDDRPTQSNFPYRNLRLWGKVNNITSTRRPTRVRPGRSRPARSTCLAVDRLLIRRHGASGSEKTADTAVSHPALICARGSGMCSVRRLSLTPSCSPTDPIQSNLQKLAAGANNENIWTSP